MTYKLTIIENNGHEVEYDFAEVSKIVEAGATNKSIKDIVSESINNTIGFLSSSRFLLKFKTRKINSWCAA